MKPQNDNWNFSAPSFISLGFNFTAVAILGSFISVFSFLFSSSSASIRFVHYKNTHASEERILCFMIHDVFQPRKRTISRLDTSAKLSISLRLREVVQILVREVLNWQVKPWENIRSFLNTCRFKSLFTFTSYFRSLFSPFWLSTERQLLSTNLQTATQNIARVQSCSQQFTTLRLSGSL